MQLRPLIAALILSQTVIFTLPLSIATADVVVSLRQSTAYYDAFAGVGPDLERRRETPATETALMGPYGQDYQFVGHASFSNGAVYGTADINAHFFRQENLSWNSGGLQLDYLAEMTAQAMETGDGQAKASMRAGVELRFSLDEATQYRLDGSINELLGSGNTRSRITLNGTGMGNLIRFDSIGAYSRSGILDAGDYTLIIATHGETLPEFTASHGAWSFRLGNAVPEPAAGLVLTALGGCTLLKRRRNGLI